VKPGKAVPVKQKQRKTKTQKKRDKQVKVFGGLAPLVLQRCGSLVHQRQKLIISRASMKSLVEEKSDQDYDFLSVDDRLKAGVLTVSERSEILSRDRKHLEDDERLFSEAIAFARSLLANTNSGKGLRISIRLANQQPILTNSAAGKYFQFFNSGIAYAFANLSNATEFASLDVLFDEVFIHKIEMHYMPRNKYVPYALVVGNVQSNLACIHFIPHNDPPYADGSTLVQTASVTTQHKLVDFGDSWSFTVHNPTRFDWEGDTQDQSTSQAGMGWCAFAQVATKYGGNVFLASVVPTAAAASNTAYAPSWPLGDMVIYFDISVRARA